MGWTKITALILAVFGASLAHAQGGPPAPPDKCAQLPDTLVRSPTANGRLFIRKANAWDEISNSWLGPDYKIQSYNGEALRFIYVAPPTAFIGRQFLSIRSVADVDQDSNTNFVNLRRHHDQFDTVYVGQYTDYHVNGKASGRLYRFHTWPDGSRSDTPQETRMSWAFKRNPDSARRRVLAISYLGNGTRATCVPFILGPNIATSEVSIEGEDEILVQKGFTIEITEAKAGNGTAGRTFLISSQPSWR